MSFSVVCGCGRKKNKEDESASGSPKPVSRLEDKEYAAALNKHREDETAVAVERNKLAKEMDAAGSRVKASLSPDVSEEEYKAALAKDQEWQKLLERQERLDQDVRDVLQEARETVRNRLMRDQVGSGSSVK